MTTNAVNFINNQQKLQVEKEIAALDRTVDFEKLGISKDELLEKIRHNKVDEYLKEKDVDASDRNGFMSAIGSILRGINPLAGAIAGAVNDESWHNKLLMAYNQATALPFSEKAGNPHNLFKSSFNPLNTIFDREATIGQYNSGIVSITYVPTIAVTDSEIQSSELQNNVRLLFTKVRSANSGNVNGYDQSDLFQFTLCSSSVFEMLRLLVRPINYLNSLRKPMNALTAWDKHVLRVMCGNYANAEFVIQNRTDIVQAINACIRSANAQSLPIGFDLTRRRSLLNGRIFTHKGARDELYIFTPACYYVYDEANGKAVCKAFVPQTVFGSITGIRTVLNNMLTPLINGTATSIMAGDMAKAYPRQVNIIKEIPYVTKGDVYSEDENILNAIMNCDLVDIAITNQLDIKQGINAALDTYIYQGVLDANNKCYLESSSLYPVSHGMAEYTPLEGVYLGSGNDIVPYQNFMNVKNDDPTRYDIMSSTRFKVSYKFNITHEEDGDYYKFENNGYTYQWGSEIINDISVFGFDTESEFNNNEMTAAAYGIPTIDNYKPIHCINHMYLSHLYSRFHYLPSFFNKMVFYDTTELETFNLSHSHYNMRLLTEDELMHLHNASFGSLISIKNEKDTNVE